MLYVSPAKTQDSSPAATVQGTGPGYRKDIQRYCRFAGTVLVMAQTGHGTHEMRLLAKPRRCGTWPRELANPDQGLITRSPGLEMHREIAVRCSPCAF